jgi:type I restriction enzyme R subunit
MSENEMKGRGTRTYEGERLKLVTPSATSAKTHFVIVDAVGVIKSVKTDSRPFGKKTDRAFERFALRYDDGHFGRRYFFIVGWSVIAF